MATLHTLADMVAQDGFKSRMRVPLLAYKAGKPFGNVLLTGTAGNGKSFGTECLAGELGIPHFRFNAENGKKQLTAILLDCARNGIAEFVLGIDEFQSARTNRVNEALLDLTDPTKREYVLMANGSPSKFPRAIFIASTNEPWKLTQAMNSRFAIQIRLDTPTDENVAHIMAPKFQSKVKAETIYSLAVAAGQDIRKAESIVEYVNQSVLIGEKWTLESVLSDLLLAYDGSSPIHVQIMEYLAGNVRGDHAGIGLQTETARHFRMAMQELKQHLAFLERKGYVSLGGRSEIVLEVAGQNRIEN